jgi:DNA-binding NarL/FixJ family response regulator
MASTVASPGHPRVLLIDDNETMLSRAAAVLSRYCSVVGTLTEGRAALDMVGALQPDVIVLDISMPGISGFEIVKQLKHAGSTAPVIFLTVYDDAEVVRAAAAAGIIGYVLKRRLASDLAHAVTEATAGRRFVSNLE